MESAKNKLVLIVGLGADLGMELARKFGRNGFDIVIMGRNRQTIATGVLKMNMEGIRSHSVLLDVSDERSIQHAFEEIDRLGMPVCGLIYNAVARRIKLPSELTMDEVAEDMKVNLLGVIGCVSRMLVRLKKQESGFILFTGGGVALTPSLPSASMSIGKAALRNYALNLAEELKDTDIFAGTVTITRKIQAGTDYSPELISDLYFDMIQNRREHEIVR